MSTHHITLSTQQHFTCQMCGRCCRRFHVHLTDEEAERISHYGWKPGQCPVVFTQQLGNYRYFARKEGGSCVFLEEGNICLMHREFGEASKVLTCRGYPFNIVTTFPGELSVLARMDCPAVLSDTGKPLSEHRPFIEKLVSEMRFGDGFTERQLAGLDKEMILEICQKLRGIIEDTSLNMPDCARLMVSFVERLERLGSVFLMDKKIMAEVWPTLIQGLKSALKDLPHYGIGIADRALFRQWLVSICRRDEELMSTGMQSRLRQMAIISKLSLGWGNLHSLGWEHPDFPVHKAQIFRHQLECTSALEAWKNFKRFLLVRLETLQFFGVAYYGVDFFTGLRALCVTYPLVLALARIHCAARGRVIIEAEDVDYAVSAVSHTHGRSGLLCFRNFRMREKHFFMKFSPLVRALGEG